MSEKTAASQNNQQDSLAWYKQEPWLAVALACFFPVLVAIYVPVQLKIPLIALSGILLAVSMAMLIRQMRAK